MEVLEGLVGVRVQGGKERPAKTMPTATHTRMLTTTRVIMIAIALKGSLFR
jgi:hypothetical protein